MHGKIPSEPIIIIMNPNMKGVNLQNIVSSRLSVSSYFEPVLQLLYGIQAYKIIQIVSFYYECSNKNGGFKKSYYSMDSLTISTHVSWS